MCIFCRLVAGELPAYKIYEDEKVLAFLDIYPISPGHSLVIPKTHYPNLETIPAEDLSHLIKVVQSLGRLLKERLKIDGYNVSSNNDPVAGQVIPHVHFHIIPRRAGDNLKPWPSGTYQPGQAEAIIAKITQPSNL